jgi:hypothetical protein
MFTFVEQYWRRTQGAVDKRKKTIQARKEDTGCPCHHLDLVRCPNYQPDIVRHGRLPNLKYANDLLAGRQGEA